ncbi:hypothetical protein [Aeromonas encheleia]|uniref:Uncharacterized protein n=1 Tax=Aeromonas encheleia TaxID=73010 RepID=A0AAE9MJS6_9GAMM|nr:hypothetical protein [Aeromonas encheleia]USV58831.1 hypothetical protein NHF51_06715 [Aeromonas encheleia]
MIVAIVESPLQLLNAFEAATYFKSQKTLYIARLSGEQKNDEQIHHVANSLQLNKFIKILVPIKKIDLVVFFKILFFKLLLFFISFFAKKIVVGNYDSKFIKFLLGRQQSKVLLVDDGAKSLSQQSRFSDKNNIDFFSMYELVAWDNQQVYRNKYQGLHSILDGSNNKKNESQVLFLGAKLSEINFLTEDKYLNYIRQIQSHYALEGLILVYVPHRGESLEKLNAIRSSLGIEIQILDYPIELIGVYQENIPYKAASFYSTALFSLNVIYGVEVDCFEFDFTELPNKEAIKEVYDLYRDIYSVVFLHD